MFSINEMKTFTEKTTINTEEKKTKYKNKTLPNIYSNLYTASPYIETINSVNSEVNSQMIDRILENEKQHNKTETWNKLNKTVKIQKLYTYAEKYKKEHSITTKEMKDLKTFFIDCLEKNKLNKTKDLIYNKEKQEIEFIPGLFFHTETNNFTLKNFDKKRVSTLKSLTPKKPVKIMEENDDEKLQHKTNAIINNIEDSTIEETPDEQIEENVDEQNSSL